jgi:hypothetical protein
VIVQQAWKHLEFICVFYEIPDMHVAVCPRACLVNGVIYEGTFHYKDPGPQNIRIFWYIHEIYCRISREGHLWYLHIDEIKRRQRDEMNREYEVRRPFVEPEASSISSIGYRPVRASTRHFVHHLTRESKNRR